MIMVYISVARSGRNTTCLNSFGGHDNVIVENFERKMIDSQQAVW